MQNDESVNQPLLPNKFVQFGCWNNTNKGGLEAVMKQLNSYVETDRPNFIVVSGDNYYPSKKKVGNDKVKTIDADDLKKGLDLLTTSAENVPIYMILGNHDLETNISTNRKLYINNDLEQDNACSILDIEFNNIKNIDFLKIDTEGYELNVLKGFEDFLENIKIVQFEYGGTFLDNNTKLIDVINYLKEKGIAEDKLVVRAHGDKYPVANNILIKERAKNRRVTVRLEDETIRQKNAEKIAELKKQAEEKAAAQATSSSASSSVAAPPEFGDKLPIELELERMVEGQDLEKPSPRELPSP